MNTIFESFSFSPISFPFDAPPHAVQAPTCCHTQDPLKENLHLLLKRLQQKKAKRLAKLEYAIFSQIRKLKEELCHLEGDALALSDREKSLRILLDRVAKEGEEDLECEKRRKVTLITK